MNRQLRPFLLAMAGGALVSVGGLFWLARDLLGSPSSAGGRMSLLELLEEVRRAPERPGGAPSRPAPPPPRQEPWNSPLRAACPVVEPDLQNRLRSRLVSLEREASRIRIDPSNFGERFRSDAFGNPVDPTPRVIVLHETVYGIDSAIQTFITPHPRDEDQVSYHALVGQDGQVVHLLDPSKRAFGAGNSAFEGQWVVTNPKVGGSINNFALHLSLETPIDGENDGPAHSGYTAEQYDAMAVVVSRWMRRYGITPERITTHRYVDLGGERADPRSFDWRQLQIRLAALGVLC